ncbi:MAG: holo-ACP synthase [Gemmatimonadaceae bacterium]
MIVGIGVDAVDIARIDRMFSNNRERMMQRLFTEGEIAFLATKPMPTQHMAVRLAAKEATFKALAGNELARHIGWRDIETVNRADGSPEIRLHDRAATRFAELQATSIHVSLSHSAATGVAVVIVER